MIYFANPVPALDRLSALSTLIAVGAGLCTCIVGPLVHELGHLAPARLFSGAGRLVLFPFQGMKSWLVVFAIDVPDERFRNLSAFQAGVIIAAGPMADLMFTLLCAAVWPMFWAPIGVGIALASLARAVAWVLNIIPLPALANDGARFKDYVWNRPE